MGTKDITTMTAKECKVELTKLQVAFKSKATVEVLRETLTAALDRQSLGVNPANDPICDSFSQPSPKNEDCATCPADHGKRNEACLALAEADKAKASGKKVTPEKRQTVKAKYADFKELRDSILKADNTRLTMFVDKLLVEGSLTYDEILSKITERKGELVKLGVMKEVSTDFKNVAIIKKHLKYRSSKGWTFTVYKNGKVKATDYVVGGAGEIIDKASETPEDEQSKAA